MAIAATASPLSAQQLSIEQCREMALQHNKDKQSAQLTSTQAEYTRKSTRALFMPDFSVHGLGAYNTGDGVLGYSIAGLKNSVSGALLQGVEAGLIPADLAEKLGQLGQRVPDKLGIDYKIGFIASASLMMKQPLYMGGKIRAGYNMSKTGVLMARENERKTEAEVIQEVDEAYANCVKANELLVVAEKYKTLLLELEKNVQSAIKHGMKLKNDELKVQVKLNEVELQIRRAQNAQRLAAMNLCHVTGQPLNTALTVSSDYPVVQDAATLMSDDVTQRPEYALLDYQAQLAADQVKMVRSEMLPQVALLAQYGYTRGVEFNDRLLMDNANFTGAVTVTIPIYHFGERTNKVKAARIKQQQAELERDNKAEMMMLELSRAANNLDEARMELELSERSLTHAEQNMKLSQQQFNAGVETLSDYLESQALWQSAYQTKVDAHFQLYLSSVAYLKAAGRLVE